MPINNIFVSELLKRLSLAYMILRLNCIYGRNHDLFAFLSTLQLVSNIRSNELDRIIDDILKGNISPAYFDSFEF